MLGPGSRQRNHPTAGRPGDAVPHARILKSSTVKRHVCDAWTGVSKAGWRDDKVIVRFNFSKFRRARNFLDGHVCCFPELLRHAIFLLLLNAKLGGI